MSFIHLILLVLACSAATLLADVQVNVRKDTVILKDGTVVPCIVLAESEDGVVIVEADPERPDDKEAIRQRLIPLAKIKEIKRGELEGKIAGFKTDTELARKVIQGAGFRKEEKDEEKGKDGKSKAASKKKKKEKSPEPESEPEDEPEVAQAPEKKPAPEPPPPAAPVVTAPPEPAVPEKTVAAPAATETKLSPGELAAAYGGRFPVLQSPGDAEQLGNFFERAATADESTRQRMESFLKIFAGADNTLLAERTAIENPRLARRRRTTPAVPPVQQPEAKPAPEAALQE